MNNNIELMDCVAGAKKKASHITVIGVGGGGSNAVEHMYNQNVPNVEFMICNTDLQALNAKSVPLKIMIGENLTSGLGAGADPKKGEGAAEESSEIIRNALLVKKTKMIFITAGLGGGTGTGAAPVIAKIAQDMGILAVGIVTMPLKAEGLKRMRRAKEGLSKLKEHLDAILIIDNAMVLKIFKDLTWEEAFHKADDILATGARSLAEILIKEDYHINVDFNDVNITMRNTGFFLMGTATAKTSSESVVDDLIMSTLKSPLLMQNDISGARNILLTLTNGSGGLKASQIDDVLDRIQDIADGDAEIILGIGNDDRLEPDDVKLIIIATGFDSDKFTSYEYVSDKVDNSLLIKPSKTNIVGDSDSNEEFDVENHNNLMAVDDISQNEAALKYFETTPSYKRLNRNIFEHIEPSKLKVVKLKTNSKY